MDRMPDDVILHIFYSLNRESLCLGARLTCTRWRRLTFDPSLWRYVCVPDHYSDKRLYMLLSQIQADVEVLEMSNCNCLTEDGFRQLATDQRFPRLRELSVPIATTLPDAVYELLGQACPGLEETENIRSTYSGECSPLRCQKLFPRLKVVHDKPVSSYGRLRKAATETDVAKRKTWLTDLENLRRVCPSVTAYRCNRGMEFLDGPGLVSVGQALPGLTSLELRNCLVDDESLDEFLHHNRGLEEITFDKPGALTDRSLISIADCCPDLKRIKVSRCCHITNNGVKYLVKNCSKLIDLHVNNAVGYFEESSQTATTDDMTDETLSDVAYSLPQLSFLRIFYSSVLSSSGIECVVAGCRFLHGIMLYECTQVDDTAAEAIQNLPFLKVLILVGASEISPKALLTLVLRAPSLNRLTFYTKNQAYYGDMSYLAAEVYLEIDEDDYGFRPNAIHKLSMRGVGSGFLQLVTVLCPQLLSLDLRDSCYVSSLSLASVLKSCELLETMDISSLESGQATDSFLKACILHGHSLRVLSLGSAVRQMSNAALCDVIAKCPSLRMVAMDVMYATDVDEELLIRTARCHHSGRCYVYVDEEVLCEESGTKQRYVELHFTPIKYLSSIPAANDYQHEQ